jgi:LuxR family maltose regulon positive regulatory protein
MAPVVLAHRLPRLPVQLLERPRLRARLDCWAPVTVVRGLAGSGKTTLIASWLADQPGDVVALWIATEDNDDLDRLLDRTLHVAGVNVPGRTNTAALSRLHEALLATPTDHKVVLVLDCGAQGLDATAAAGVLPSLLGLAQRHRHFHLVTCSRGAAQFEATAAAAVDVNAITTTDLMFDRAEIAQFARAHGRRLSEREQTRLHAATGGWIAPVRLILDAATGDNLPFAAANSYLKSVLLPDGGELDDRSPLRFSLADRLDSLLIGDLADGDDPDDIVATLESSGLTERSYDGDSIVFSSPTLVRDTLRSAYTQRHPQAARAFHARLACWYETRGGDYALIALNHAVASEDCAHVHRLWAQHGMALAVGHPHALRTALSRINATVLDEFPGLRLCLTALVGTDTADDEHIDVGFDRAAGLRAYMRGSAALVDGDLTTLSRADLLYAGAGHLLGLRAQGRPDAATTFVATVGEQLRVAAGERETPALSAWFHLQAAVTAMLVGADESALEHYQLAWDFASRAGTDFIAAQASADAALVHTVRGELSDAAGWRQRYESLGSRLGDEPIGACVAAALQAIDRLDEPAAAAALAAAERSADPLCDYLADSDVWPMTMYARCQYALHFGDPAAMIATLEATLRERGAPSAVTPRLLARAHADLLIANGEGQRARALIGHRPHPSLAVALARLQLVAGDFQQARNVAVRVGIERCVTLRDELELRIVHALAALRLGDREGAAAQFTQLLTGCSAVGIPRVLATIAPQDLAALFDAVSTRPIMDQRLVEGRAPVYAKPVVLISLTKGERSLIEALATTGSRREIAETRFVSLNTVKTQMRALYHKLGTTSRDDTLTRVRELGLMS